MIQFLVMKVDLYGPQNSYSLELKMEARQGAGGFNAVFSEV